MTRDNIVPWSEYAREEWERMGIHLSDTWTAADPLTVEETPADQLTRQTSRDTVLLCIAGMVIIAVLAYLAGRASA